MNAEVKAHIYKADNGYVVQWHDGRRGNPYGGMSLMEVQTDGLEIFAELDDALARLKGLLK